MKLLLPGFLVWFLLCWGNAQASSEKYNVLYINSYHTGYSWTDDVTRGVVSYFNQNDSVLVFTEFLDALRHTPEQTEAWFLPYLQQKYQNTRFDVIIASDNSALDLVLKHRSNPIFSGIPIVFGGISNPEDYPLEEQDLYGVIETDMFVASFEVMQRLVPEFKTIYLLIDRTVTGNVYRINAEETRRQYPNYHLVIIDSAYYSNIGSIMAQIEGESIVFYQGISVDGAGNPVDNLAMAQMVFEAASVPVFSSYAIDVEGALGGMFMGGVDHGKLCAQLAEKRFKGLPIENRINTTPIQGIYDYSKLVKFNIDPKLIPPGSKIIHKPESIWNRYKKLITANIIVISALLFLIFMLFQYNAAQAKSKQMLEKAMEKAYESDRLKGAFLANVSHELRTPLNAICGFSELVKYEMGNGQLGEYVDVIYKNSELLARLVNDLLDISLIDANAMVVNKTNIDLEELFKSLEQQAKTSLRVKDKTHIAVQLKTNPTYRKVITDDFRVSQIMINFINNAAKYTEKGEIVLGYDHITTLAQKFDLTNFLPSYLVLYVKDTGIGIDTEKIPLVFERFRSVDSKFMSHHGGFGLGLNISKSLAELLGGAIFVKSSKGKGSVFGLLLPV